jgi:polar amino acid transport system substrate-binding protein
MGKIRSVLGLLIVFGITAALAEPNVVSELAPTGKLRVGMNGNNTVLVTRNADGTVGGLCADLGRFLAGKLGVGYEAVVYESAAPYTASFGKDEWDIVITGKNAVVEKQLDFSADLFLIDYVHVAAPNRQFASVADVDAPGVRIAVPRNASADVYLSRTLKSAQLVRVDGPLSAGIELLQAGKADVYSSSINSGQELAERMPGAKVIGAFYSVPFTVATDKGLSSSTHARLRDLINDAKNAGLVRQALEKAGAQDVRYAP